VLAALAEQGLALLTEGSRVRLPRDSLAAALPAALARRDLRRARRGQVSAAPRGLGDRLGVIAAAAAGRP
jgi:hypothetical protein